MSKLRILVVDDSAVFRQALSRALSQLPDAEVVATANDGRYALQQLDRYEIDVMTLDVEMPVLGGLETLELLAQRERRPDVVMVSSQTGQDSEATLRALELGAYDFVTKPSSGTRQDNERALGAQLRPIISALGTRRLLGRSGTSSANHAAIDTLRRRSTSKEQCATPKLGASAATKARPAAARVALPQAQRPGFEVIGIGISTGGPAALTKLIPALPASLGVPIVLVQHMPKTFTGALARALDDKSALSVVEASDGQRIVAGTVYIAPGGSQLRVQGPTEIARLRITDDPPEHNCKPAVDYLFRSLASVFGDRTLALIMTGMGSDGVAGLRMLKATGAHTLAQDRDSCVVFGMPGEAVKAGVIDEILPLEQLAARLSRLAQRRESAA